LFIDISPYPTRLAFDVLGSCGGLATTIFQLWGDGTLNATGPVTLTPCASYYGDVLTLVPNDQSTSALKIIGTSPTASGDLLRLESPPGAPVFRIGADGKIYTNQAQLGTVSGQENALLALYNADGTVFGWIPVYNAATITVGGVATYAEA
jgi:hypothetical protein